MYYFLLHDALQSSVMWLSSLLRVVKKQLLYVLKGIIPKFQVEWGGV